jgi:hypothetical protein
MIYKTNPISRLSCVDAARLKSRPLEAHHGRCLPHIVFGVFQIPRQNAHRFPPTRPHDCNAVVAARQQVLRGTNAQRVAAERVNCRRVQADLPRRVFDEALDEGRLQRAVDRLFLIDAAEQRPTTPPPLRPPPSSVIPSP